MRQHCRVGLAVNDDQIQTRRDARIRVCPYVVLLLADGHAAGRFWRVGMAPA